MFSSLSLRCRCKIRKPLSLQLYMLFCFVFMMFSFVMPDLFSLMSYVYYAILLIFISYFASARGADMAMFLLDSFAISFFDRFTLLSIYLRLRDSTARWCYLRDMQRSGAEPGCQPPSFPSSDARARHSFYSALFFCAPRCLRAMNNIEQSGEYWYMVSLNGINNVNTSHVFFFSFLSPLRCRCDATLFLRAFLLLR